MYLGSGGEPSAVMRFGRWESESAFEKYIFPHMESLMQAQQEAHFTAPYFELN